MSKIAKIMGIKKPKAPDTSKQEAALAKQEEAAASDKKNLQIKQNATLNASRARRAGYRSLVTGLETGVEDKGTGARANLG